MRNEITERDTLELQRDLLNLVKETLSVAREIYQPAEPLTTEKLFDLDNRLDSIERRAGIDNAVVM